MAAQIKTTEVMLPRRNEYVRGSVKRDNLVRIAAAFTGSQWPDGLPAIEVRKLSKPEITALAKRGKKAKAYKYAAVDGVHRVTIALATLNDKVRGRFNAMLRERGQEPLPPRLKLLTIPANVVTMSVAEAEVEQLRTNLSHGLLLDKKHRDEWVRHLIKNRKYDVGRLAKLLHLTERSVYRMAKGEQTKAGPRKKSEKKAEEAASTKWEAVSFLKLLHSMASEVSGEKNSGRRSDLMAAIKADHENVAKWLDPLVEALTLTAATPAPPAAKG